MKVDAALTRLFLGAPEPCEDCGSTDAPGLDAPGTRPLEIGDRVKHVKWIGEGRITSIVLGDVATEALAFVRTASGSEVWAPMSEWERLQNELALLQS